MKLTANVFRLQQQTEYVSPLLELHQSALATNAYELVDARRQQLTQLYLTTEKTLRDLRQEAGVKDETSVRYLIKTSIEMMFPHLPKPVQELYKSPKEALQLKARTKSPVTIRRMRDGIKNKLKGSEGEEYRIHLSQSATRRWKRSKEKQQTT